MRYLIFSLMCICCISCVFADDSGDSAQFSDIDSSFDSAEDLQMGYSAAARMMPSNAILGDWALSIEAAFIYWNVNQQGMSILKRRSATTAGTGADSVTTYVTTSQSQSFSYHPGFTVALETSLGIDNWLGKVNYIRLHSVNNRDIVSEGIPAASVDTDYNLLYSFLSNSAAIPAVDLGADSVTITSNWSMNLNLIDFTISRPFFSGRKFILNPSAGIRFGWLNQNWTISSDDFAVAGGVAGTTAGAIDSLSTILKSDSWLVGPFMRCDYTWMLGLGFQLVGYSGAFIFQQSPTVNIDATVSPMTPATATPVNVLRSEEKGNLRRIRASVEGGAGLAWGSYMVDDSINARLAIRYDFMYVFNQNFLTSEAFRVIRDINTRPGNLGLHGLTIHLTVGF